MRTLVHSRLVRLACLAGVLAVAAGHEGRGLASVAAPVRSTTPGRTLGAPALGRSATAAAIVGTSVVGEPDGKLSLADLVNAGRHWRLETPRGPVHVWIPPGYAPATAATVVFVHGYYTDVDTAWVEHRLPEQFAASGLNAMFIACGAPSGPSKPMVWASLYGLLRAVHDGVDTPMPRGRIIAVGHSGAYRTMVLWLANPRLSTVILLDAAYEIEGFRAWARSSRRHRLINIADDTIRFSNELHRLLPSTKRLDRLPDVDTLDEARAARVLYIRTDVGHMPIVTGGVALPVALRTLRVGMVPEAPTALPTGFGP